MSLTTPRLVLLVLGALLVLCGAAVGVAEAFKHDRTVTQTVDRHIDRVVINAGTGNVHLQGTAASRVTVQEKLRWLWRRPRVRVHVSGSTLTVSGSCPSTGPVNRCKSDLDLAIPFDADVVVAGDTGNVTAERLAGHLELRTDTGDVEGRDLNPASVRATTDAGDVDLAFTTEPVSVSANSSAGDIRLSLPQGGEYRVDAGTNAGEVDVQGVVRNDMAVRSISASTDAGDVTILGRPAG
jgi:hypothetical protein